MILQYRDEDSGEPVQIFRLARAFSASKKIESGNRFWMLFHKTMIKIAAAVHRHAEFPQVRQSQWKIAAVTVKLHNCVRFVGQTMN